MNASGPSASAWVSTVALVGLVMVFAAITFAMWDGRRPTLHLRRRPRRIRGSR